MWSRYWLRINSFVTATCSSINIWLIFCHHFLIIHTSWKYQQKTKKLAELCFEHMYQNISKYVSTKFYSFCIFTLHCKLRKDILLIKLIWAMVNFFLFYRMLCWCAYHAPWSLVIQQSLLVLLHKSIKPYMRREERDYWPVLESKACCCFSIEKRSFVWNKTHPVVSQV